MGGSCCPELYYTMMVVEIVISPLRERREDIIPLARMILDSSIGESGSTFDSEAEEILISYDWPGNFSELNEVMNQAIKESQNGWITGRTLARKMELNSNVPELVAAMS